MDGKVLREARNPVQLAPLSAINVDNYTDADLLKGADPVSTVVVFDLLADGEPPSRGVVYFKAAKDLALPDPRLHAELRSKDKGYLLELHADQLARGVWVDFGDTDADISDNALTLLPGENLTLQVSSQASLATLRKSLRLRSVADVRRQP